MSEKISQLEHEIVQLFQQEDKQAIRLLYENYGDALYGMILRIVRSESIAEEVLQDVLVKVWKNASQYNRKKGRLFTWLANISRNTAIDAVRSARYQRQKKTDQLDNFVYEDKEWSAYMEIEDSGLRDVIDSLDNKYRVLIDMVYFQGYSHRAVEEKLNIPLGTVKTRLRQAILSLREKLGDERMRKLLGLLIATYFME